MLPPPTEHCVPRCCSGPGALEELSTWLAAAGIVLVAADELQHETFQKDRQQVGLQPGQVRQVMPIALAVTSPQLGCYVRVHRRHGTLERRLEQQEIQVGSLWGWGVLLLTEHAGLTSIDTAPWLPS